MFTNRRLTLTWMVLYSILSVCGFFMAIFLWIARVTYTLAMYSTQVSSKDVPSWAETISSNMFSYTPLMFLITLSIAWYFYSHKDYKATWFVSWLWVVYFALAWMLGQ